MQPCPDKRRSRVENKTTLLFLSAYTIALALLKLHFKLKGVFLLFSKKPYGALSEFYSSLPNKHFYSRQAYVVPCEDSYQIYLKISLTKNVKYALQ